MIERQGLTLVGVAVGNLDDDGAVQLALPFDRHSGGALDAALDEVRDRFGSTRRHPGRAARPRPGLVGADAPRLSDRPALWEHHGCLRFRPGRDDGAMRRPEPGQGGTIASRRSHAASRMLLAVLAATLLSLVVAPGAVAHTRLTATTPANDAVLGTSPALVTLRFSEPVETAFGSVRVYDGEARRVDDGRTIRPSPDELAVGVDRELPKGTYTVAWRVVSADAHPIHGAFVFHVGRPGVDAGGVADELLDADAGSRAVSWSFGVVRFLGFAFILLTAGGGAALAIWVPERDDVATARRRLWLTVAGASLALATVTLAAIGLQGASAAGQGLHGAVRWSLVQDVVETRFGEVALARVVLAAAIAVLAVVASRHTGGPSSGSRSRPARWAPWWPQRRRCPDMPTRRARWPCSPTPCMSRRRPSGPAA